MPKLNMHIHTIVMAIFAVTMSGHQSNKNSKVKHNGMEWKNFI